MGRMGLHLMSLADDLERAADYIEVHGWTRGGWEKRGRVCLLGALEHTVPHPERHIAAEHLRQYVSALIDGWISVPNYNDRLCKSKQEAMRTLRAAAHWQNPPAKAWRVVWDGQQET
jgi:hypothetical protein